MKRLLHIVFLLVLFSNVCAAQPPGSERRFERIHAIKVAYITDRLKLNGEESARFWPVYNKYDQEKRALRKRFSKKCIEDNIVPMDDAKAMRYVDEDLDYQEHELALKRRYKDKLQKVLSPQQLAELYTAERDFKIMLLQQLNDKHGRMDRD